MRIVCSCLFISMIVASAFPARADGVYSWVRAMESLSRDSEHHIVTDRASALQICDRFRVERVHVDRHRLVKYLLTQEMTSMFRHLRTPAIFVPPADSQDRRVEDRCRAIETDREPVVSLF